MTLDSKSRLFGGDSVERGFGFVYGCIPTAPSVLVYAYEYLDEPRCIEQVLQNAANTHGTGTGT